MSKKMIYLVSFVLLLSLASTSYGVVLGDFENPADPNHDEWLVVDANLVTVDYEGTKGVTHGDWSLKVDANEGAQNAIAYNVIGNGMLDEFRKNLKISLDATRMADEWVPDSNGRWTDFAVAVNAGSSGDDPNDPNDPNDWSLWYVMPEQEGDASWLPPDGNNPISLILNYSLAHPQIDYDNLEYLEIVLQTNWGGFDPGGTYYIDNIQMFSAGQAYAPSPADEEREVLPETTLSWIPGAYGDKHDVYFGTSYADVNDANASDTTGIYRGRKDANTYDPPGFLESSKRYYWRIDEVNEAGPDPCLWKGDVWSFTTEYPIVGTVIGDWEQNMDGWGPAWEDSPVFDYNQTPETVTLGEYSLSVQWTADYWIIQYSAPEVPETLENTTLMFDYTAYGADFSNWAEIGEKIALNSDAAPGWKEYNGRDLAVVIDRNTGEQLDSIDFGSWEEIFQRTYTLDVSDYDLTGATWFSIVISCNVDVKTSTGRIYLDYARLVDARLATNPVPTNYEENVRTEPTLTWTPGKGAVTHDVYFGTDKDDVTDANRTNKFGVFIRKDYDTNSIDIADDPNVGVLELGTIYHWRIDEVNGTDIAKGPVWTFMTGNYLVIDDFESYSSNPKPLGDTWKASSKADVSLSTDPVHEGDQAMTIAYDNNTPSPYYSEAYADTNGANSLDFGTDWTINGVEGLSLWFRGNPDVRGSFDANTYTINAAGWDIEDTADGFHYAYKELGEPNLTWQITAKVDSLEDTGDWAKAGIMVRKTLEPNSANVAVVITPGKGIDFQYRETAGGDTTDTVTTGFTPPQWLRLTRAGAPATIYVEHANTVDTPGSSDWEAIGALEDPYATYTAPMYIGLCVSSFNTQELCTAQFSNVSMLRSFPPGTPITGSWADKDIGIPYNDPEEMYVVLEDSDSNGIVYHPDPNATQTSTWTHWGIELDEFSEDVNLEDVQRMYIGFGNRGLPILGGPGTVHFDDIRLYAPGCVLSNRTADFAKADYAPEGNPSGDCVVDFKEIDIMGRDWLKTPPPNSAVDLHVDDKIDFKDFAALAMFWLEEQISLWP